MSMTRDPLSKRKRALKASADMLQEETVRAKRRRAQEGCRPFTWDAFSIYFSDRMHGGYNMAQLEKRWAEHLQDSTLKRDRKGVVGGVAGQLRLWIPGCDEVDRGQHSEVSGQEPRRKQEPAVGQ